jgi:hypothetical protein
LIAGGLTAALKSIVTVLAAALLAAACSSSPEASQADTPKASDIRALRWLAPGADKVKFLTTVPASCETPATGAEWEKRQLGKLAFESPALLGGAAARMGLSCSSCHLNGRGNSDFFLEGVSDKPGAADVTSSLLSKVRGDGNFNSVPIPDIGLRDGKQIRDRKSAEFRIKVHGLIVEEFDGQEPPAEVLDAVVAYLDGLDPAACAADARPVRAFDDLMAAEAAYDIAAKHASSIDARVFYVRVARFRLERLYERLPGPAEASLRRHIVSLSNGLGEMAEAARSGERATFIEPDWMDLLDQLSDAQDRSFYDPGVLQAALAQP